ncbi:MAG: type II toxin-antitoxin system VapC family toxin [Burkholderiales bacterium]|nr:type II toxin-antitoxin system VapC family toxin [Burkholderiales bacterium]
MKLLLDTHIWLWSLVEPARLGRRARSALASERNELWLSPLSVWELLVLAERRRVRLEGEPRSWIAEALERTPAREAPLTHEIAVRSREILSAHADPADRFLVATALVYGLTLVTADVALIEAKPCSILASR